MPAGRPTDYTPELLEAAWEYARTHDGDEVPSVAGLCDKIGISRNCAYEWAKDENKQFNDILETIAKKQEKTLLNKGLSGEFNSTITKLMLTKHGYSDKQETDLTSGGKPIKNEWHIYPVTTDKHGAG